MPSTDHPHLQERRPAAADEVLTARQVPGRRAAVDDAVREAAALPSASHWQRRRFVIPTAPPRV